jgi:hypothetical protein
MVEILVIPCKQDKNIKETYHKKEMFYVPVFIHLWPGYPPDQTYYRPSKSSQQKIHIPPSKLKEVMSFTMTLKNKKEIWNQFIICFFIIHS